MAKNKRTVCAATKVASDNNNSWDSTKIINTNKAKYIGSRAEEYTNSTTATNQDDYVVDFNPSTAKTTSSEKGNVSIHASKDNAVANTDAEKNDDAKLNAAESSATTA